MPTSASQLARTFRAIASLPRERLPFSAMARELMVLIRETVPCDTINLGTVDLTTELGFHYALDGFLMPEERRALLPRFKHQNPMIEYARRNGTSPPLRFIDFTTRRQFEERPIYRECYRGYTYSMLTFGVEAPAGLSTSFVLSRGSGEFSDSEQESLALLQPLVSSVIQRQMLEECLLGTQRSASRVGIVHGSDRFIHTMDPHAQTLLRKYYQPDSLHRVPEAIWPNMWNAERSVELANASGSSRLLARLARHEHGWTLHLWEEGDCLPSEPLSRFGFTGRQIEVIQWMALGKTNPEIAIVLNISYRTVQKHLENVYAALGVETRIAAINRCRELAR